MNSRIGRKLLFAIIACIVLVVVIVSSVTILRSAEHNDSLMLMHTESGLRTLRATVETQADNLEEIYKMMVYTEAFSSVNTTNADKVWEILKDNDSNFAAIFNAYGSIYWKSENYNLTGCNPKKIGQGYSGVVNDPKGGLTIQYARPTDDGGAVVIGLKLNNNEMLDKIKAETNSELSIFSGTARYATTIFDEEGNRALDTPMADSVVSTVIEQGQNYKGTAVILGQNHYTYYEPITDINGEVVGAYLSCVSSEESDALKASLAIVSIIVAVVVAAISLGFIGVICVKVILNPIKEAEKLADNMSKGNLHEPSSKFKFGNDELGDFVRKLEFTKETLNSYISDIRAVLSKMATGDFTAKSGVEYLGDFIEVENSFEQIEKALQEIIGNINQSSNEVLSGSSQIAEGSQVLADGTTKQAAAIEELSASINEIAVKVQESAHNAGEARKISNQSAERIKKQNVDVENMLEAMDEIKKKSDQIRNIIKAIDDIAFQTNILALNAAVEAARAGEAGKGFAVVADEVRNLAAKSAESANQTGILINATIEAVDKGTVIAQNTADAMKEVNELSVRTNAYIEDISTAAELQSSSIEQIKSGIEDISTVVQQNSATAEETAASCSHLSSQSANLKEQIDKLKV